MTPFYLYIKIHNVTGLRYLGQTKKDPFEYKGSGLDWLAHIKIHGNDVRTEILAITDDKTERNTLGRYYSNLWRITTSVDNFGNRIWANRIPETGGSWVEGVKQTPEHVAKRVAKNTGKKRSKEYRDSISGANNPFFAKKHTIESKEKMMENAPDRSGVNNPMFGKRGEDNPNFGKSWTWSEESKQKVSGSNNPMKGRTGENHPNFGKPVEKFECLNCGKKVSKGNFNRWHGNNCKAKT